jgi:hypothetical protein
VGLSDTLEVFKDEASLPAITVGGGITGFLTPRVGLSWELRKFRSFGGETTGLSIGPEQVSFWRASMAVVFRASQY